MKGFGWWQQGDRLERRLQDDRPVPPVALLDEVVRRIEASRPVPATRVAVRRVGLAGVAAAMMLGVFAAFGGVGFAASGASDAASSTVDAILTIAKPATVEPTKLKSKSARPELKPVQATVGRAPQPARTDAMGASATAFSSQSQSAAIQQYSPARTTICHFGNGKTLILPTNAAASHLANHPDDYPGPC